MKVTGKSIGLSSLILTSIVLAPWTFASDEHSSHGHEHAAPAQPSATAVRVPALSIVMPADNDTAGSRMAVAIETDADLATHTLSSGNVGTHLHIDIGEYSVMPTRDQLASLGGNRYAYVFDMPMKAGTYQLCVSWAGADHRTIASSIRCRSIKVR